MEMSTSCFDYVKKNVQPTNPGSQFKIEYVKNVDENGIETLVESGKTDLQAYYNGQADSCDLSLVLSTMIKNGINPGNAKIVYSDDYDDFVDLQKAGPDKLFNVAKNFKDNESLIKQYEAEIEKLKNEQASTPVSEVNSNGNE